MHSTSEFAKMFLSKCVYLPVFTSIVCILQPRSLETGFTMIDGTCYVQTCLNATLLAGRSPKVSLGV